MTATPINLIFGPGATQWQPATALSIYALNDADDAAAWVFNVPKSGTIAKIGIYCDSAIGSPPAYNVAIVTLDSAGRPTTTNYGGSSTESADFSGIYGAVKWIDLTTDATATAGDFAAVYIYPTATAPNTSNYINVPIAAAWNGNGFGVYYSITWVLVDRGPTMAIQYDDGAIYGLAPGSATLYRSISSNSDPDEYGIKITPPADLTVSGARIWHVKASTGSSGTYTVTLYDNAGTTLASATISDKDQIDDLDALTVHWTPVTLSAGAAYRVTVTPGVTGTGGRIYMSRALFDSAAALAALPNNAGAVATYRTDAGAWTDATAEVAAIGLIVTAIEFGGGGGSGGGQFAYIG